MAEVSSGGKRSGEEVTLSSEASIATSSEVDIFVEDRESDKIAEGFVLTNAASPVLNVIVDDNAPDLAALGASDSCLLKAVGLKWVRGRGVKC